MAAAVARSLRHVFLRCFLLYLVIWADGGLQAFRVDRLDASVETDSSKEASAFVETDSFEQARASMNAESCLNEESSYLQEANRAALEASTSLEMHRAGLELQASMERLIKQLKPSVDKIAKIMKEQQPNSRETIEEAKDSATKLAEEVKMARQADARLQELASRESARGNPLAVNLHAPDEREEQEEMPRPFSPLADLAEGIASVGDLLPDEMREKLLSKASSAIEQHVFLVDKMKREAKQGESMGGQRPLEEVLDDSADNDTINSDKQEVADLSASSGSGEETGGEDSAKRSLVSWSVLDMDVEKMDAFMRIKVCKMLEGLDCEACSEDAASLAEYQDCVKAAIATRTADIKLEAAKLAADSQLHNQAVLNKNWRKAPVTIAEWAFHGLQFYGVHRNWAQWSNMGENPLWPLETLRSQKAKDGWAAFTKDSQAAIDAEVNEFGPKAAKIAETEAKASANWAYKKHGEEHVTEANELKSDAEQMQSNAAQMQAESKDLMADAEENIDKAERLNKKAADLNERNEALSKELEEEAAKCEAEPPTGCDPDKIKDLSDQMSDNADEAKELNEESKELQKDAGEMKEDAKKLEKDAEELQDDANELKDRAKKLQEAVKADMKDPKIRADIAAEARRCAIRIAEKVGPIALHHIKEAAMAILALVPDLLWAACEAALDIITGFGWIITAVRLTWKLAVFARKKYKQMRDRRQQKICAEPEQMSCCVNSVMTWHRNQVNNPAFTEKQFLEDTEVDFDRLMGKGQCAPFIPTLYDEAPDLAGLENVDSKRAQLEKHSPDKLLTVPISVHYTRLGEYSVGRTITPMQMFITTGVVVTSKITPNSKVMKVSEFPVTCEDFLPGEVGKASLQAFSKPGFYEGGIKFTLGPQQKVIKFAIQSSTWQSYDDEDRRWTLCSTLWKMCHAACAEPARCNRGIDRFRLAEVSLAANGSDLLQQCVSEDEQARLEGVIPEERLEGGPQTLSFGPAALRLLVWHDLLYEGRFKPRAEPESRALAHAMCSKHVLPSWRCAQEDCSICEGVGSLMQSRQQPMKWCKAFAPPFIDPGVKPRDVGRYAKCEYITKYFQRTEDYNRLSSRKATVRDACTNRGFCKAETAKLPRAKLKPRKFQKAGGKVTHTQHVDRIGDVIYYAENGTMHVEDSERVEHEDTNCRLCVEFVQRAASGLRPIEYCRHWDKQQYPMQRHECELRLEQIAEGIPKLNRAIEDFKTADGRLMAWLAKADGPALIFDGHVCDRYCEGTISRDPQVSAGLSHSSPLLLPDQEDGLPHVGLEKEVSDDEKAQKEDIQRAKKAVTWKVFDWSTPTPEATADNLVIKIERYTARWEGLLKELAWEGKYTTKRVWPRNGQSGMITEKLEQACFLMLKEVSFLRSHVSLVGNLVEAGQDVYLALDIVEQLGTRLDKFLKLLREMAAVLEQVKSPVVPQSVQRLNAEFSKDAKEVAKCHKRAIERHEKYTPILESLSDSLSDVATAIEEARADQVKYDAKSIGLTSVISQFYLMLPVEEQSYWQRFKNTLFYPFRYFKTQLLVGKMYEEEDKYCNPSKWRKFSYEYVRDFRDCCSARFKQINDWEMMVRETNDRLNKILDMMDYVRGDWFTSPIRRAARNATNFVAGRYKYRGFWVQEEAANFLRTTSTKFAEDLHQTEVQNNRNLEEYTKHTEALWTSYSNVKVRTLFRRRSRFEIVKLNAKTELDEGHKRFSKVKQSIETLKVRIEARMRGEDGEPAPLFPGYMPV